jgi:hypothetical protein
LIIALCLLLGVSVVGAWFLAFFGIALLTSLYDYFVEKRVI